MNWTRTPPAPPTLREILRALHSPMRGALQAKPGQKAWCGGCGGVIAAPCPTRRLLDGEPVDLSDLEVDPEPFGTLGETA